MSETYTNGHSVLEENVKNAAMTLFHGESVETVNKALRDASYENTSTNAEKTSVATPIALNEQIELEKTIVEVSKPKDGIYELCNNRKEKLLPFLNNNSLHFEKLARSFAWEINTNDKLKCCSQISMVNAFYKCCEYGLDCKM